MSDKCERCGNDWGGIRFRDESELPENAEEGYFCEDCFESINSEWWDEEKLAYTFDNEGNRGDHPDFNSNNAWMEDRDD